MFDRCTLRNTRFDDANLEGTRWQSCRGGFALFPGADLSDAEITACDFNNAVFRRTRLTSARFRGCKLTGADFQMPARWMSALKKR
jgi:fluoroquinolone resistance protein